jgi:hypothetical protein
MQYKVRSWEYGKQLKLQAPVVLSTMPRVKIGQAQPDRKTLDVEIARLREAWGFLMQRL